MRRERQRLVVRTALMFTLLWGACSGRGAAPVDDGDGAGGVAGGQGGAGARGGAMTSERGETDDGREPAPSQTEPDDDGNARAGGEAGTAAPDVGGMGGAAAPPGPAAPPGALTMNFESLAVGARPGAPFSLSPMVDDGMMKIDDRRAYSGKKSLFIDGQPFAEGEAMKAHEHEVILNLTNVLPKPIKTAHARVMVYVEGAAGSGHYDLVRWIGTFTCQKSKVHGWVSFGGFANEQKYQLFGRDPVSGQEANCKKGAPQAITPGRWVCLQLKLDATSSPTHAVAVDGKAIKEYSVDAEQTFAPCLGDDPTGGRYCSPEVTLFRLGYRHVGHQQNAVKVWYDDLVIDDEPVACPDGPQGA